jgi:glycosyltransferase involved in cell wall biosynthesis
MKATTDSHHLSILHVLTLNGRNGEYGGPVRVARELCTELNSRGHTTHIFSGALKGSEPTPKPGLNESYVLVKPLLKRLAVSTMWSWKLVTSLKNEIKKADVVHIHFARDLIPFLAAFTAIISRKPFITQTHGMIISDGRLSTRIIDSFFTRPLINKSLTNLVLTQVELSAISKLGIKSPTEILPNGIAVSYTKEFSKKSGKLVAFCSRLDKRKGVLNFIELADSFKTSGMKFEIYGPDGGELELVQKEIQARNLKGILEYRGSLPPDQVKDVLNRINLLVLPSVNEPFPMVILESLSVGTAVLVMPSCGLASNLSEFNESYVSKTEDLEGLCKNLALLMESSTPDTERRIIQEFCKEEFGITKVCERLVRVYRKMQRI